MKKLSIEEYILLVRMKAVRTWSLCIGMVSIAIIVISVPLGFHHAVRSPHNTAFPAFRALADAGYMTWLIFPLIVVGVLSFGINIFIWWNIRKLYGE